MSQVLDIAFLPIQSSFDFGPSDEVSPPDLSRELKQLREKIGQLEVKLEKKNQLVKYLQRKCGNQIIKTTHKLQEQILKLQHENSNLKNCSEFSKHSRSLLSEYDQQYSQLGLELQDKQARTPLRAKNKRYDAYRQELLKLTHEELRDIVIMQARELFRVSNNQNQEASATTMRKSLGKDTESKHLVASASKKHIKVRQSRLRDSNENLNKVNTSASALKDSTSNLNISSPSLSASKKDLLPQAPQAQPPQPIPETASQCTQTEPKQQNSTETQTQTEQTMTELEQNQMSLIELKIENQILRKEVESLMKENAGLKEEALYFEEKFKDYYKEYEQVGVAGNGDAVEEIGEFELESEEKLQVPAYYCQLIDNYRQILEIFGLDPNANLQDEHQQDKKHQKLLHEICNVKLQISHLLKQFKKLEKELNETFTHNRDLQCQVKYQQEHLVRVEEYNGQLACILGQLNQQVMVLRHKYMHLRYLRKLEQEGDLGIVETTETQGQGEEIDIKEDMEDEGDEDEAEDGEEEEEMDDVIGSFVLVQ